MSNNNTSSIELLDAFIYDVRGKKHNIRGAITGFFYYESIDKPFITAVANILDSGSNFISTLPIQGGEQVIIRLKDVEDEIFTYNLSVWKVYNRVFNKNAQTYNLALISREALFNEGVRITQQLKGTPDKIVEDILKDYLNTDKKIHKQNTKFQLNFYPQGKKAHAIIQSIAQKTVPNTSGNVKETAEKTNETKTGLSGDTSTSAGTAGFLFFENADGFHFKSIDFYYSDGSDVFQGDAPAFEYQAKPESSGDRFVIEEYMFDNEMNLIEQMRSGTFASHLVTYNWSTGHYEEHRYNLSENFKNMAHLGSQDKLGSMQKTLAANPSRIMSVVVDHETWFDGEGPGSVEPRDNDSSQGSSFPDYQKHWLAQSIARHYFMQNQKMEITVPGNLNLKVGDKISIKLPNMAAETVRKKQKIDEENSGTYLVSSLSHNSVFLNNTTCTTKVELIRDVNGMKDGTSNVK